MKAMILAAGEGKRIKSLFPDMPKPLIPLKGKPLIEYLIELLQKAGTEVLLNIKESQVDRFKYLKLPLLIEDTPLGNAGAIKKFAGQLDDTFLVLHSDIYTDIDINALIKTHQNFVGTNSICASSPGALMTMTVKRLDDGKNYGIVLHEKGKVIGFTRDRLINCGIYVCNKKILKYIGGGFQDLDKDLFPKLLKDKKLFVYMHKGIWCDVGTPDEYSKCKNL